MGSNMNMMANGPRPQFNRPQGMANGRPISGGTTVGIPAGGGAMNPMMGGAMGNMGGMGMGNMGMMNGMPGMMGMGRGAGMMVSSFPDRSQAASRRAPLEE